MQLPIPLLSCDRTHNSSAIYASQAGAASVYSSQFYNVKAVSRSRFDDGGDVVYLTHLYTLAILAYTDFISNVVTNDGKSVSFGHRNSMKTHTRTLQHCRFIFFHGNPAYSCKGAAFLTRQKRANVYIQQPSLLPPLYLPSFHYPTFFILQLHPPNSSLSLSSTRIQKHAEIIVQLHRSLQKTVSQFASPQKQKFISAILLVVLIFIHRPNIFAHSTG